LGQPPQRQQRDRLEYLGVRIFKRPRRRPRSEAACQPLMLIDAGVVIARGRYVDQSLHLRGNPRERTTAKVLVSVTGVGWQHSAQNVRSSFSLASVAVLSKQKCFDCFRRVP